LNPTSLALDVKSLEKRFRSAFGPGTLALGALDLQLRRGRALGLVGPNGAGKTTLIKLLLGVLRPTEGSIEVLGGSPHARDVRARIGYLPERLALPPTWTPLSFVASVARLKGLAWSEAAGREVLGRVGLAPEVHTRKTGGFSKGMKQRTGLAAALMGSPELLILDEPTDGIDPIGRAEIRELLMQEKVRGATVLLNSHLLSETERVCDEVAILNKGRIIHRGPMEERSASSTWKVRFDQPRPDLEVLGFVPLDAAGTYQIGSESPYLLNQVLDEARSRGALLLELRPEIVDLEEILKRALKEAA
jgi:ABC-2 type transport system ATP-binding protein